MKLIEKKCPNCGASLSFNDTDKSCKCEYCKRSFEIERDNSISSSFIGDQFKLSEFQKPLKFVGFCFASTYVVGIIISIIVIILIAVIGYNVLHEVNKQLKNNESNNNSTIINNVEDDDSTKYITSIDDISNDDYENIDTDAKIKIINHAEGVNDARHSFTRDGDPKMEKIYVASKDDGNVIVSIYKVSYKDFFHQDDRQTIYVPIVYENIEVADFISNFKNPQIKAPEYYFDSDNSSYAYGYGNFDEAYNNVVKVLENDYKISEK